MKNKNFLVTGSPGCGKTTLIQKLTLDLEDLHPVGFFTSEIRVTGTRQGFALESTTGKKSVLAHVMIRSPHRVGKYAVDILAFEEFILSIPFFKPGHSLIIIDEIGRMECISDRFKNLVNDVLSSDIPVVATIAKKGDRFIEDIKRRNDVDLYTLTSENRDHMLSVLLDCLREYIRERDFTDNTQFSGS